MKLPQHQRSFFLLHLWRCVNNPIIAESIKIKAWFTILIILLQSDSTDGILEKVPYVMLAVSQPNAPEDLAMDNRLTNGPLIDPYQALVEAIKAHNTNPNKDLNSLIETFTTGLLEGYPEQFEQILTSAKNLLQIKTSHMHDENQAISVAFLATRMQEIVQNNSNIQAKQKAPIIAAIQGLKQPIIPDKLEIPSKQENPVATLRGG